MKLTSLLIPLISFSVAMADDDISNKTYKSELHQFKIDQLVKQNDVIWGFDFLPDGKIIFTEREGKIKTYDPVSKKVTEISGGPKVWANGQGGMLDIRVKGKDQIYICYSETGHNSAVTSLAVATFKNNSLDGLKRLYQGDNTGDTTIQFGCRIEFDGKGHLFLAIGDREARDKVQKFDSVNGKIIRLNEDGTIPKANSQAKANHPEIWSYGHRNPEGLAIDPKTGDLWEAEMGPRGGDELNLIKPGLNYGWPVITYGREYSGPKIGEGTAKEGMEQPVAYWVPSISPSGICFYEGDAFPKWKGDLFMATLSGLHLRRLTIQDQKVTNQEVMLKDLGFRFRNVRQGPDGNLYFSTDNGIIAKIIPAQ